MADIRINQLPEESVPNPLEYVAIDGETTRKSTIKKIVDAGSPIASQAEAEAGTNAEKRMTPLATKQSIASQVGVTIASQANGALASTAVQPARQLIAGAGLIGGGDLSSDRTFNVGAGTGINVTDDAVGLDVTTQSRLLPPGGNTGNVLAKTSATNYAVEWSSAGSGDVVGPNGGVLNNDVVVFDGTTAKLIKKAPNNIIGNALLSQLAAPAIKGRLTAGAGNVEDLTPAQANQLLGGWEPIGLINLAAQAGAVVTDLSAFVIVKVSYFYVLSSDFLMLQVSTNNGSTFANTGYRYNLMQNTYNGSTNAVTADNNTNNTSFAMGQDTTAGEIVIHSFNKALNSAALATQNIKESSSTITRVIHQEYQSEVALNAFRLQNTGAGTVTGRFFIEGIRG